MNGVDVWAFLVARGRRKGHRAILVPDFLADIGSPGLLAESVSGAAGSQIVTVDTPAGVVTVLSRTHRLTSQDVDGGLVTDQHGRPLELLYGLVCRIGGIWEVHEGDFDEALNQSLQAYRRFLADEDRPFEQSTAFSIRMRAMTPSVTAPPASVDPPLGDYSPAPAPAGDDFGADRSPRRRITATGVAVLGAAAAIVFFAVGGFGGGGPVAQVVATADPADGEVDCSKTVSITVHVRVTTDGPATVRWTAGHEGESPTRLTDLVFDKDGTKDRDLLILGLKPKNGVIKGSYEVVTDEPNKQNVLAPYELRCAPASE